MEKSAFSILINEVEVFNRFLLKTQIFSYKRHYIVNLRDN
ncbi:hypothetical protein J647_3154 [Acinetobacter baumannii 846928]|nr:hypothetical protein ACINNAV57_0156 [Acinetobacter baumannii Naval-57]EXI36477.1 hypothetical protein J647_3154 [Acinetobacter baumannii 846928]